MYCNDHCVSVRRVRRNQGMAGASLVELLIVVFIIALLLQLLLPAVEMARESARMTQCSNNLRQLALGAQMHLNTHGFMPTGGWAGKYTADPNRGYGKKQPGGWAYSLLAYVEETELREAGKGESMTAATLGPGLAKLHQSAPRILYCPSRRLPRAYPLVASGIARWGLVVAKGVEQLPGVTKSDYAANTGDALVHAAFTYGTNMWVPEDYSAVKEDDSRWTDTNDPDSEFYQTGISYYRSEVRAAQITDGLSRTYLFGEKFMDPVTYKDIRKVRDGGRFGDNQSAWAGFEWDNHRVAWQPRAKQDASVYQPQRDKKGAFEPAIWAFGSAHLTSMNMAYCDGSVSTVSYDVDRKIHRAAANRLDGGSFSGRTLD